MRTTRFACFASLEPFSADSGGSANERKKPSNSTRPCADQPMHANRAIARRDKQTLGEGKSVALDPQKSACVSTEINSGDLIKENLIRSTGAARAFPWTVPTD